MHQQVFGNPMSNQHYQQNPQYYQQAGWNNQHMQNPYCYQQFQAPPGYQFQASKLDEHYVKKHCEDIFKRYDRNKNGEMDMGEA